jgi:hypothetical protein
MATEGNAAPGPVAGDNVLGLPRVEGELRVIDRLATVREESGTDSAAKTGEPKEGDFAEPNEASEGSAEKKKEDSAASSEIDEEDSAAAYPVIYDYKDDDDTKERIGCTMDSFQVREMGREHYALVGPTAQTGATLVCTMVDLVPGNVDQFGIKPAWTLKRKHVCEMGRGKDMHFMYATMDGGSPYEDDDHNVAITT